ncbi:MAG TPA: hypothetical protein DE179_04025 [Oceanospirillaceae bacterium]|nr:hypothetical protein [Oceanospirillaceae bacterium]
MSSYPKIICAANLLEDNHSLGFQHKQEKGILVRYQGHVYAYVNRCPHRQKSLGDGPNFLDEDRLFIRCAQHQALFTMDSGSCITGPCSQKQLTSLAITEQDEQILLLGWPRQVDG